MVSELEDPRISVALARRVSNSLVDSDYKQERQLASNVRPAVVLSEPGFYQALAKSKAENAKLFQKWLYEEVIPSIRKTGQYSVKLQTNSIVKVMDDAAAIAKFMEARGVKPGIATQYVMSGVAKISPDSAPLLQACAKEMGQEQAEDNNAVTPSIIAEQLTQIFGTKISAVKVNEKLKDNGLQLSHRTRRNKIEYTLTTKGKQFGQAIPQSIQNGNFNRTKYDIRWNPDVVNYLVNNWN